MKPVRKEERGFTLIELMIALLIGSFGLAAAANVVQWATRKSGQGLQNVELTSRARIVAQQLRQDITIAGYSSSGAVGLSCGSGAWNLANHNQLCITTGAGLTAMPAVRGYDNVNSETLGGISVKNGTDMIQVVVPNPATAVPITDDLDGATASGTNIPLVVGHPNLPLLTECVNNQTDLVYLTDHSAPNGAGRAFVAFASISGSNLAIPATEVLGVSGAGTGRFAATPGAEVMCARVSTYWVDVDDILHRTDLRPGVAPTYLNGNPGSWGVVTTPAAVAGDDIVAPGVEDLQFAYGLSSAANGGPTAGANFNFGLSEATAANLLAAAADTDWFEVRNVRFTLVMRGLRAVEQVRVGDQGMAIPIIENQPAAINIPVQFQPMLIAGAGELGNLKLFDDLAEPTLDPEPY